MQCKLVKSFNSTAPSSNTEEGTIAWSKFPLLQQSNSKNMMFSQQVGSVDSTGSSFPGQVLPQESSQSWFESYLNYKNNVTNDPPSHNSGRTSFSSDCSDMSIDDISVSSDAEESDTSNGINKNTNTLTAMPPSQLGEDLNNNITTKDANHTINKTTIPVYTEKKTKKKENSPEKSRLYDDEGYIRRAACVCLDETESKVLLVSSKKDPCSWLVPGGGMETGEDMATAAIREAWEEAGVKGHITKYLGLFETEHQNGTKKHRTGVFVVSVTDVMAEYPESYLGRCRQWFPLEEALLHLARTRPLQSAYLQLLLVSRLNVASE